METEDIIEAPLAEGAVAFMLRCHAGSECWEVPEWAVLTITPERARSLLRLCETVRELGVYKIADFDYSPGFYAWGEDDSGEETVGEPVRTEIDQVSCYADGVRRSPRGHRSPSRGPVSPLSGNTRQKRPATAAPPGVLSRREMTITRRADRVFLYTVFPVAPGHKVTYEKSTNREREPRSDRRLCGGGRVGERLGRCRHRPGLQGPDGLRDPGRPGQIRRGRDTAPYVRRNRGQGVTR